MATAYNRAYLASPSATPKFPLWGTSDTLGTLYSIGVGSHDIKGLITFKP